jgi:EKC/KEOPS complex subunit PCC1/LAGE3
MKRSYAAMADTKTWKVEDFPCTLYASLTLSALHARSHLHSQLTIPFPSRHYALTAQRVLSVDAELSPLVRRAFHLAGSDKEEEQNVLVVDYAATTNRMLRVAVNGFFESVGVVIGVMKELDVDVVYEPVKESLEGVQGLVVNGQEGRG